MSVPSPSTNTGYNYLSSETTSTIPSLAVSVTTSLAAAAAAASATKYVIECSQVLSLKTSNFDKNQSFLTLVLLQKFDCLELFDDVGKGVWNDGDHDQEGKDQDEDGGHDGLDILEADPPVL